MNVERFDAERHVPILLSWHVGTPRTSNAVDPRLYPSTGFVVDGCAVGFLYLGVGTSVGFVANVLTDPRATPAERRSALERLADVLIAEAEALGVSAVRLATNDPEFRVLVSTRATHKVRIDATTVYRTHPTTGSAEPLDA